MLHTLLLLSLPLSLTGDQDWHRQAGDLDCWDHYSNRTSSINATFDLRISGVIDGGMVTIEAGTKLSRSTTANHTVLGLICAMITNEQPVLPCSAIFGDWCEAISTEWCKEVLPTITNITRTITIGFDGESVYGAMRGMEVFVNNMNHRYEWGECLHREQRAYQGMAKIEFPFTFWNTSAVETDSPPPVFWYPEETVVVSGASLPGTTILLAIYSIALLF